MPKHKSTKCGNELVLPQLTFVSCPHCGTLIGKGAFLNTSDPCFDASWKLHDYIVVEGVRLDRNGALVCKDGNSSICTRCPVNRREVLSPWPKEHERRLVERRIDNGT
jgi:hypothetical protein